MADMYLYNGVKLPVLPASPKTNYMCIMLSSDGVTYRLWCLDGTPKLWSDGTIFGINNGKAHYYLVENGVWVYKNFVYQSSSYASAGVSAPYGVLWTNTDIKDYYNSNGSEIYLSASEPALAIDYSRLLIDYSMLLGWMTGSKISWMIKHCAKAPLQANCLTFSSKEHFTVGVNNAKKNWDGVLYYSADAETWNEWDGTVTLESVEHNGEQRVYMRGSGNTCITQSLASNRWVSTGSNIRCDGNIENLLDYETVAKGEHPKMAPYCFAYLFYQWSNLISAPELRAIDVASGGYWCMFYRCTSLVTTPELPATNLNEVSYYKMFSGCTSLTTLPKLPSTTLVTNCYRAMFENCTGIKLSETKTTEYTNAYRIPNSGDGVIEGESPLANMFKGTGGTFTGTPKINQTYYLSNSSNMSGICGDDLIWELQNGILTISGTGDMYDYEDGEAPWLTYRDIINTVIIQDGATSIGSYAFAHCINLTTVEIPASIQKIGSYAFYDCTSLTSINVGDGVTDIGDSAFKDCTKLQDVTISGSTTNIGNSAFAGCDSLTSITIPGSITNIGGSAFEGDPITNIVIPNGVTKIEDSTFKDCTATNITIPNSVTSIGAYSFANCTFLTSITIPASVTEIGEGAFAGCTSLANVYFEGNAPSIHNTSFTDVNANCYYNVNDTTWTEDVRKNYGGTLTWILSGEGASYIFNSNNKALSVLIDDDSLQYAFSTSTFEMDIVALK